MDGTLMKALHGNLHVLSELNLKALLTYYYTGFLTYQERASLLKEITEAKATSQEPNLLA